MSRSQTALGQIAVDDFFSFLFIELKKIQALTSYLLKYTLRSQRYNPYAFIKYDQQDILIIVWSYYNLYL